MTLGNRSLKKNTREYLNPNNRKFRITRTRIREGLVEILQRSRLNIRPRWHKIEGRGVKRTYKVAVLGTALYQIRREEEISRGCRITMGYKYIRVAINLKEEAHNRPHTIIEYRETRPDTHGQGQNLLTRQLRRYYNK